MPNRKHRKPNPKHLDRLVRLGCVCCLADGIEDSPVLIHHPRFDQGFGQRAADEDALPLCHLHHLMVHEHQKEFAARYGSERQLLARVRELLGVVVESG